MTFIVLIYMYTPLKLHIYRYRQTIEEYYLLILENCGEMVYENDVRGNRLLINKKPLKQSKLIWLVVPPPHQNIILQVHHGLEALRH